MSEDDSAHDDLRRLVERLESLEHVLKTHTERLYAIESQLGLDFRYTPEPRAPRRREPPPHVPFADEAVGPTPAPPPVEMHGTWAEATPPDAATHTPTDDEAPAEPRPYESPFGRRAPSDTGDASDAGRGRGWSAPAGGVLFGTETRERPSAAKRRRRDVESLVGGSWFNWLGIIAIVFGAAFFLKYAFDNQWITPAARVALGAGVGLSILALAEVLRGRGLRQYAYVLSGGGVLILYLSVYAARAFYGLVGPAPAFLLMSLVTAVAVALSVRHDAIAIAILSLLGGFATPVLLSTGQDRQVALFTYIALLDAGLLAVAYFKQWRILNFLAFFATTAMFIGWMEKHYAQPKLWPTVFFLTLFFLLFSALAPVHNVLRQRPARWFDILLVVANASFYFTLAYTLLDEAGYGLVLGSFALTVSALYVLLFYFVWDRHREDRLLRYSYVGAAVTFFTMAVAIQLDWHWVTIGWATEGLMLTWVGLRARESALRHAALPVFAVALAHWSAWDAGEFAFSAGAEFVPLLNPRAFSCAALIAAFAGAAWLYRRAGAEVDEGERSAISGLFVLASGGLGLTLLTLDVNDYFNQRLWREPEGGARPAIENARQFSLTTLWAFYGATALVVGLLRRWRLLRYGALLLLAFTTLKLIAVDATFYAASWHVPLFNQTFMGFALVAGALAAGARFYARTTYAPARERDLLLPALTLAANVLLVAALSLEAAGYFDRALAALAPEAWNTAEAARHANNKWFAISVVWIIYAASAFVLGVRRRSRPVRYAAVALLALTVVKVLLQDLAYYAAPWHAPLVNQTFAAFALLVAALGLVHWLYGRADGVVDEERAALPVLVVAANLLAIIALSAEASGHFEALIRAGGLADASRRDLRLAQGLSLSVIWALYGGAMLAYGHLRRNRLLRLMALALLGLTTLKVFFRDLSSLDRIYRIISFVVLGMILLAVSYLYQKRLRAAGEEDEEEEDAAAEAQTP